jgi:hypothetical protein
VPLPQRSPAEEMQGFPGDLGAGLPEELLDLEIGLIAVQDSLRQKMGGEGADEALGP